MNKSRFTSKELFALQAVYRGCNTNKRLVMIDEELEKEGKYNE